jgi:short chain dehydrogenase
MTAPILTNSFFVTNSPSQRLVGRPFGASSSTLKMVADDAKVVLVTGSSRGLGKAVAMEIGKAQQKVVINYVSDGSKASAEEVVSEIKALGGDAIAVQCDSKFNPFNLTEFILVIGQDGQRRM